MVSPLLNDLRNPILSSFFLLCKFLQSFLISGGFSFDCSAVAGVSRISVVVLCRLLRGLVISFRRCGWWTVPVCCGHCFHAASEGDEHCCRRRCGSVRIPKCSSPADCVYRSPVDCCFSSLWTTVYSERPPLRGRPDFWSSDQCIRCRPTAVLDGMTYVLRCG